jgi:hypothetical protein
MFIGVTKIFISITVCRYCLIQKWIDINMGHLYKREMLSGKFLRAAKTKYAVGIAAISWRFILFYAQIGKSGMLGI